jgi:DNA replication and repair protein RecF
VRPARISALLTSLSIRDLRGYAALDVTFGPGPQLVFGPNAAGKTSLLEAIALLAWGRSQRTSDDGEVIRWGSDLGRVEGGIAGERAAGTDTIEVALVRSGAAGTGARKRIRVNGVARRASGLSDLIRVVVFAPEEMLLIVGPPSLRRDALDRVCFQRSPVYATELATYARALAQRNALLRAVREAEEPDRPALRQQLHLWDAPFLEAGSVILRERHRLLAEIAEPLSRAHQEIAPDEAAAGRLGLRYVTNAPAIAEETPADALARRLADTSEKETWNGSTLVGPHRDDLSFELAGRDLSSFASRGQQRTAILAWKLAEVDLLSDLDGQPPLLLLDDVFSELDTERRSHLVRRIADLPQAFVTTTTLDDLDARLVTIATRWEVVPDDAGARLVGQGANHASDGAAVAGT